MLDVVAFKAKLAKAPAFIQKFKDKKLKLQIMMEESAKSLDVTEKTYLLAWVKAETNWLNDNLEEYKKCEILVAMPKEDLNNIFELYKAIYGD